MLTRTTVFDITDSSCTGAVTSYAVLFDDCSIYTVDDKANNTNTTYGSVKVQCSALNHSFAIDAYAPTDQGSY